MWSWNNVGWVAGVVVLARLNVQPEKLAVIAEMERTGGDPDVIGHDAHTGEYLFCDCSAESPAGRRSLCYDGAARAARKANAPESSALEMAADIGVTLLTENEYRTLQTLGKFDQKTSSWIHTPPDIRRLGGALFCDRRYETVFVYHNGQTPITPPEAFAACCGCRLLSGCGALCRSPALRYNQAYAAFGSNPVLWSNASCLL